MKYEKARGKMSKDTKFQFDDSTPDYTFNIVGIVAGIALTGESHRKHRGTKLGRFETSNHSLSYELRSK